MSRVLLTDEIVNELPLPAVGTAVYWDTKLIGFGVACSRGKRSWVVQKRVLGKPRGEKEVRWLNARQTLGDTTLVLASVARQEAKKWLAAAELGVDPRPERKHRKKVLLIEAEKVARHPGLTTVMRAHLRVLEQRARARSNQNGWPYQLWPELLDEMFARQDGRCALTKLPMILRDDLSTRTRPWAPSIDRIDSAQGYAAGNVHLVCVAANVAKGEWPLSVFRTLVTAAASNPFL